MKQLLIKYKTTTQFALVDDNDFEWLSSLHWNLIGNLKNQYAYCSAARVFMHHLVLLIKTTPKRNTGIQIDHINHNTLDNRKQNLRIVSRKFNALHRKNYHKTNSTLYRGVHTFKNPTYSTIMYNLNGRNTYGFPVARWAALAALARELEIRDEFEENEACNFKGTEIVGGSHLS